MEDITITPTTTACFIDLSGTMTASAKAGICFWISHAPRRPPYFVAKYENYMRVEFSTNYEDLEGIWVTILKCDHIWCRSDFSYNSAKVFCEMLKRAQLHGIKDKVFFDLMPRQSAMKQLLATCRHASTIMAMLESNNGIRFLFIEDILT